jgi:hypothetical protein
LDFFIYAITHILTFLKYVRFVQIDLPSFLHLKPGSTSRRLSYLLTSTPSRHTLSRHTLIAMANLLWVLKFLISSFVLTWCPLNSPLCLLPLYIKKIIGMFINYVLQRYWWSSRSNWSHHSHFLQLCWALLITSMCFWWLQ